MPESKFPRQLYAMVSGGFEEVGWAGDGESIWISNPERLAATIIPQFFDHASYASLHRSLNSYDFHKVTPSTWKHPLFRRDRPVDLDKIHRKHVDRSSNKDLNLAQRGVKAQLEAERRKVAALRQKAQQMECELRELQDADAQAQQRLAQLERQKAAWHEKAEAAAVQLDLKLSSPLTPAFLAPDLEEDTFEPLDQAQIEQMELEIGKVLSDDVTLEEFGLTREDLKPAAARIIDDDLAEIFQGKCTVVCGSVWKNFEHAASLSEAELRGVFNQLDVDGTGRISRDALQNCFLELWRLGPGSEVRQKCPGAFNKLTKMLEAVEHAAREVQVCDGCGVLSPESLAQGQFTYKEFCTMMHAWKEWHGWKDSNLSKPPTPPAAAVRMKVEEQLAGVEPGLQEADLSPTIP